MVDGWSAGPTPGSGTAQPRGFAELAAASFNASGPGASQTSDLPPGWERKVTPEGQPYFVNHNDCTTHWEAPAPSLYPAPNPAPAPPPQAPLQPAASFGGPPAPAGWSGASGAPSVDGWGGAPTAASPPRMQRTASMQLQNPEHTAEDAWATFNPWQATETLQINHQTEQVHFTKYGTPYITNMAGHIAGYGDEQSFQDLSLFSSLETICTVYGPQIRQYFNFLRFIIFTNLIFFLLTLISFVPHVSKTTDMLKTVGASLGQGSSTSTSKLDILFLSSYQPSSDGAWTAMVALCSILSFLTGPMYILASTYIFKDYIGASERNLSAEDDVIEDNRDQTAGYNLRLIINYLLFCVCCGVPALIMYVMFESIAKSTMQQSYDRGAEAGTNAFSEVLTLVYALVPSAIVSLSNIAFASVVDMLNRWDKHPTWSKYRNHRLFKILGFRIVNVMCLFVFKYFSDVPFYTCVTRRISFQVFTFIIMELTINNFMEIFLPAIMTFVGSLFSKASAADASDEDSKPEFELSEEYFEITYRQFIMYMGISVFPMLSAITLATNILELVVDRYRLMRVCARPKGMVPGGRKKIFVQLMGAAVFGLLAFPCGLVWFADGSFLCWPCPHYSKYGSSNFANISSSNGAALVPQASFQAAGGESQTCSQVSEFEEPKCFADGNEVSVAEIRFHVDRMRNWDQKAQAPLNRAGHADWLVEYRSSNKWLADKKELRSNRRCACNPCVQVKMCGCDKSVPTVETAEKSCDLKQEITMGGQVNPKAAREWWKRLDYDPRPEKNIGGEHENLCRKCFHGLECPLGNGPEWPK